MKKPKTLKQLKEWCDDELSFGGYTMDCLKEEAICWIKSKELDCHKGDNHTKEWIMHFFGITKGDLE